MVHMGEMKNAYNILVRKPEGGRDHLVSLGMNGRVILQMKRCHNHLH